MKYEPIAKAGARPAAFFPLLALPLLFLAPVTHDSIWQVWVGRQMLHGARLYTDIVEVNPPLIFWLAMPQAAIGEWIGLGAAPVTIMFTIALTLTSLFLSPQRYILPLLAAFTLLPLAILGKAEHFALVATAPYVFLIAARMGDREIKHAWLIGFFASLGFAMKPYFAIVPIALEFLVWTKPRIRPETIALAVSAALYAAAVLLFAPTYLAVIVPMARQAYAPFAAGGPSGLVPLAAFLIAGIGAVGRKSSPTGKALMVAALAFLPAVFIQDKGWPYQSIPARGFLFLAIASELMRARGRPLRDAALCLAAILCFYSSGLYHNYFRSEFDRHVAGVPRGASIDMITTNPGMAWPMVEERGLRWIPRQMCLWQLPASWEQPSLVPGLKQMVADDLAKRPDLVIVDERRHAGIEAVLPSHFHQDYKLVLRTPHMASFRLRASAPAAPEP
ncbi:MAG TPA: hypothetical protein VFW39_10340 [Sphingomicrobium sp.]|nr:hypothetical protein [Sphingomicrobium sp.]